MYEIFSTSKLRKKSEIRNFSEIIFWEIYFLFSRRFSRRLKVILRLSAV